MTTPDTKKTATPDSPPWLEQIPAILWVTDKNLILTHSSGTALVHLGFKQHENVGKNLLDLLESRDPEHLPVKAHRQALEGISSTYETRFMGRTYHTHVDPYRDTQGNIQGTIGIAFDITDRDEAQESLIQKTTKTLKYQRALLSLARMKTPLIDEALRNITKMDAHTLEVSRVSIWFFNETRDSIVCQVLYLEDRDGYESGSVLCAEEFPDYFKALESSRTIAADHAREDPRTYEFNSSYLTPLGITSMLDVPIRLSGMVVGIVCHEHVGPPREWSPEEQSFAASVADLVSLAIEASERKKAEVALRKTTEELIRSNQELEQFAYVASHDLQEPLHKIIAFADRLQDRLEKHLDQDPKAKDYFQRLQGGANRMRQLIEDLLQVARITTRAQPFEEVDLDLILKAVISDLELRVKKSGGEIHVESMPKIRGDALQLHQLFQNLLGNALKFSRPGISPQVQVKSRLLQTGLVEISVIDNGIGIDPQYWEKIFKPFQRLHSREQFDGSGMGLTLCQKIVERHGGKISVSSRLGQGSEFKILVPFPHSPPMTSQP